MKGAQIALDEIDGRPAAALVTDGRLEDLIVEPAKDRLPPPGTICEAIADRPVKGMGGMFVRLPDGLSGFLRQAKGIGAGGSVLVQVTSYAEPGKAIPVTTRLTIKSKYVIVTPGVPGLNISRQIKGADTRARLSRLLDMYETADELGIILRSSAEAAAEPDILEDLKRATGSALGILDAPTSREPRLLQLGPGSLDLAGRDWPDAADWDEAPNAFARLGILEAIDALRRPDALLPGGGSLWIEPTRALVAVDVNTGADTSPAAGLKANLAAARELPRQLRCRGLAGQIVIDPAPMPKKTRREVEVSLQRGFGQEPIETTLLGWTPLGLIELRRQRLRWQWTTAAPR